MIFKLINRIKNKFNEQKTYAQLPAESALLIQQIKARKLTYLTVEKLGVIDKYMKYIQHNQIEGKLIECGCALGGSSVFISKLKKEKTPFEVYDVFGMIPAPTHEDTPDVHNRYEQIKSGKSGGLGGDRYYGYEEDLLSKVKNNLAGFGIDLQKENISLIKGLVQDTLKPESEIAFAHIDVDWYDPVKTCLNRIHPFLSRGGIFILDDYNDWGGCRKATDEFLSENPNQYHTEYSASSLVLRKM